MTVVSVTSLLGVLDLSIVNIALPHEQRDPSRFRVFASTST
ncbi:hypothetical protein AB0942_16625 [Streptomyces nodosus]